MEIPIKNINSINQYRKIMFGEITIVDGSTTRKIENVDKNTIQFFIDKVNEQKMCIRDSCVFVKSI